MTVSLPTEAARASAASTMTTVFVVVTLCLGLPCPAEAQTLPVMSVMRVYDGDTISQAVVRVWPGQTITTGIRLRGIDTPEMRGGCADARQQVRDARDLLATTLLSAQQIEIRDPDHGLYAGRVVADVYADGVNVTEPLLAAGLAVPYDGQSARPDWCAPAVPSSCGGSSQESE